ncbi:protein kinase [Halobaculum sp. WSA2]|uniref:Protein kinase n=1 Tax=Halobaculum saliterrae TaxID=2073113 RepID=A0A6B0SQG5_9EURY|nr:serine/threonine-protein kinase [Halobaculum saliterrae]MXR40717.1 protein kinase [Halobaculum saliterrae]
MSDDTELTWEEIREQFTDRVVRLGGSDQSDQPATTTAGTRVSDVPGTEPAETAQPDATATELTRSANSAESQHPESNDEVGRSADPDTATEAGDAAGASLSRSTNEPTAIPSPPTFDAPLGKDGYVVERLHPGRREDKLTRVYKAEHPDIDDPVVLKGPNLTATRNREDLQPIVDEAKKWRRFADADHVVTLLNSGDSVRNPWIVMEYMDGGDLTERIGELSIEQALWTGICIVYGVYRAHRQGVQHLDIKPSNVLFTSMEDAWDIPKVGDWGESQTVETDESSTTFTPKYAAPEQHLHDDRSLARDLGIEWERFDSSTTEIDQYQLGVVIYELLTGTFPFETDEYRLGHAKFEYEPQPPSELVDDLPSSLDEPILKALQRDPHDRHPDVSLFLRELTVGYDDVVDRSVSFRRVNTNGWTTNGT